MRPTVITVLLAAALGGCVSQSMSIRSLPAQDPAAENAAAAESAADGLRVASPRSHVLAHPRSRLDREDL